jgi:hypothetical protein
LEGGSVIKKEVDPRKMKARFFSIFLKLMYLCGLYSLPVFFMLNLVAAGVISKLSISLFCLFFFLIIFFLARIIGNKVMYIPLVAIIGIVFCCTIGGLLFGEKIMFFLLLFAGTLIASLIYSAGMVFYKALEDTYFNYRTFPRC